jgi:predicted RNA binding protein YcfA (HicA-like mRNA interferase family)
MPPFGPISRRELIRCLRALGFDGPYAGGKHAFMIKDDITLRVPNPHQGDIGRELLARILRQAGVSRAQWEQVG